jgi:hypothetical protein
MQNRRTQFAHWLRRQVGIRLLLCATFLVVPAPAQHDDSAEYRLKLAFLFHLAQFVDWPQEVFRNPDEPLTICVAGQDPFQGEIERGLRGRTVQGRAVRTRKWNPDDDPRPCQMMFVRAAEKRTTGAILASLKGSNILTVGESKGFAELGGIVNLTLQENRLHFEVNLDAANLTRLRLSAKLLALARIIRAELEPFGTPRATP